MIDPNKFGVSFSIKQCRSFQIDSEKTLDWLIQNGFRRFRLMSYWDEIEKEQGVYDFAELDRQFAQIEQAGGTIILCLGVRQPRWPESHWPKWALDLPKKQRYNALYKFIRAVVERYRDNNSITNYQLENEFFNRSFGPHGDFSRKRLRREFALVKSLDPNRPIAMTYVTGLPIRQPVPDIIGHSLYRIMFINSRYVHPKIPMWFYRLRAWIAKTTLKRPSFIHELQAEPWGHKPIWEMPIADQNRSMPIQRLQENIRLAKSTNLYPIDLWGGEWWYWRWQKYNDASVWETVQKALSSD